MTARIFLAIALVTPVVGLQAQVPSPGEGGPTLSVADALRLARENSPVYRQTVNDRGPAAWGVRNAYAAFLPTANASGSLGYTGAGSQTFLATTFEQRSSTVSSSYSIGLGWSLSGAKLTEPGLRRAQQEAVEADIAGARQQLEATVTQQYLAVLEARENAQLAVSQLARNQEFQRLAQARYEVGQATLIDVRQAQVARGQSDVALLQARQAAQTALLQLFRTMGVIPPEDVPSVQLTDTFVVQPPEWTLDQLLAAAEERNPSLVALRERASAAKWGERAARSQYFPTLAVSAGWAGFTQEFTNVDPLITNAIRQQSVESQVNLQACNFQNEILARLTEPLPPFDCSVFLFTPEDETALAGSIRDQNDVFPFDFTRQPFSARLTVSVPIFTGFQRALAVSQARAQREDADLFVRDRALAVRTEVSQRFLEVATAHRAIAIQDTSRLAGREQLQLATERYRVGSGTFFELLDAQLAAQRAEADYITAVYAYHRAVAALEAAVGQPLR